MSATQSRKIDYSQVAEEDLFTDSGDEASVTEAKQEERRRRTGVREAKEAEARRKRKEVSAECTH